MSFARLRLTRPLEFALPLLLAAVVWVATAVEYAQAGDWPQILGPRRNGEAIGETLAAQWPAKGPPVRWSRPLGMGFSGPVAAGGKVIIFHRVGDRERVEALDAASGERQWSADFDALYRGGVNADLGPRCTPLVHQGRVYVFGAAGDLHCVELASGAKRFSRAVYQEFGGDEGYFGAGSSPVAAGGKLLINVGGRNGAGIVAFALGDGKTVWKSTDEGASYSSPAAAVVGGQQHVVFATRMNAVSIDPENGEVLFRFPFGKRGPTVNAATPLVFGDKLFLSSSYGVGARMAKIGARGADVAWSRDDVMSSQYTTCVQHQGHLYGAHGREDIGVAELRCIEADSGDVQWAQQGYGVAHVILANGRLLILTTEGRLALADASPRRYRELAGAKITSDTTRALPALSNGNLYLRTSTPGGGRLMCLHVGAGD